MVQIADKTTNLNMRIGGLYLRKNGTFAAIVYTVDPKSIEHLIGMRWIDERGFMYCAAGRTISDQVDNEFDLVREISLAEFDRVDGEEKHQFEVAVLNVDSTPPSYAKAEGDMSQFVELKKHCHRFHLKINELFIVMSTVGFVSSVCLVRAIFGY